MSQEWHNQIKAFEPERYRNINLDRLTVYAIKHLRDRGIESTFENIVVTLYKMFPGSFSLVGFNEYPDSNRVNRQLLHCRPKYRNYVTGNMRQGWLLTEKGLEVAEEAEGLLETPSIPSTRQKRQMPVSRERTKSIHFVNEITNSEAYNKYQQGLLDRIADIELCYVLHANLDTPPRILTKSLQKLKDYARTVGNNDVMKFLEFIQQRLGVG
jgi:hypothetical protein